MKTTRLAVRCGVVMPRGAPEILVLNTRVFEVVPWRDDPRREAWHTVAWCGLYLARELWPRV